MKVGELKELISKFKDDSEVLLDVYKRQDRIHLIMKNLKNLHH